MTISILLGVLRSPHAFAASAPTGKLDALSVPFSDFEGTSQNPAEVRLVRLLDAVQALGQREDIAYVWGGRSTSSPKDCTACRQCVESLKVDPFHRMQKCSSCKRCGVDCSGFVSRILVASGLSGRRVTSASLIRSAKSSKSMFAVVGQDLKKARVGDLVVLKDHVVIFLDRLGKGQLAYIHATKFISGRAAGGIEVVVGGALPGKVSPLVILRHKDLANAGTSYEVRQRVQWVLSSATNRALKKSRKQSDPESEPDMRLVNASR